MSDEVIECVRAETPAPLDREVTRLDVRDLGPPNPLRETLETLAEFEADGVAGDAVLVQVNDRAPQHLYPKLTDRGYEFATVEREDATVTAIWQE